MKYCGIDLHSNNCVVVVSDAEDRIIYEARIANDLERIRASLELHKKTMVGVVFESTYN